MLIAKVSYVVTPGWSLEDEALRVFHISWWQTGENVASKAPGAVDVMSEGEKKSQVLKVQLLVQLATSVCAIRCSILCLGAACMEWSWDVCSGQLGRNLSAAAEARLYSKESGERKRQEAAVRR